MIMCTMLTFSFKMYVSIYYFSGWLTSKPKLPKLGDYFHYKVEVSIPTTKYSYDAEVKQLPILLFLKNMTLCFHGPQLSK